MGRWGNEFDGEPALHFMRSLSVRVCTLIQNLENETNPDVIRQVSDNFKDIETRMDLLQSIRNYLYIQGYQGESKLREDLLSPCQLTYVFQEELTDAAKFVDKFDLTKASFGKMLKKLSDLRVYKLLSKFLSETGDRQQKFIELKTKVNEFYPQSIPTIWIMCGIVSYTFFLLKYFQNGNDTNVLDITKLEDCLTFIDQSNNNQQIWRWDWNQYA